LSATLHVESVGSGAPLVLLHGWGMHSGMWGPLTASLAKRFRVHAVDIPGHGHSAALAPWTFEAVVDAIRSRFAVEAGPPIVVGWSLGGLIALAWARAAPASIARLVLVATTPSFVTHSDWLPAMDPQTLARFGDELRVAYRMTLLRFLSLQLKDSEGGKAALAALRARLFERPDPAPATLDAALHVLASVDLRSAASHVAVPTLVIAGERDTLVPPGAGAWLARAMPDARYIEIRGAAHVPFLSHPAQFTQAMMDFLDADARRHGER
jgi:pimeloyl-[acyl-carrier protein] methyl ester esterase